MDARTRDRAQLVLVAVVTVAWLIAVYTGRGVLLVSGPFLAVLTFVLRDSGSSAAGSEQPEPQESSPSPSS